MLSKYHDTPVDSWCLLFFKESFFKGITLQQSQCRFTNIIRIIFKIKVQLKVFPENLAWIFKNIWRLLLVRVYRITPSLRSDPIFERFLKKFVTLIKPRILFFKKKSYSFRKLYSFVIIFFNYNFSKYCRIKENTCITIIIIVIIITSQKNLKNEVEEKKNITICDV